MDKPQQNGSSGRAEWIGRNGMDKPQQKETAAYAPLPDLCYYRGKTRAGLR